MTGFTNVSGSATVTLNPPATATGPALTVDVGTPDNPSENPHTISPYVYGMNAYVLDSASEKIANPGILRWGGDDTSRYNYQYNMTNSATDYYFENFSGRRGTVSQRHGQHELHAVRSVHQHRRLSGTGHGAGSRLGGQ